MKIIDIKDKNRVVFDVECPLSRQSVISWVSYSEEGQLYTYDSHGVFRAFSFKTGQWTPALDLKIRYADIFERLWVVGITDGEVLAIELGGEAVAPMITQKN